MAADNRRVAVVTGASSGIGKETAKALAAQGWRVIAIGRDPGRSAAAEEEIRAASGGGKVDMIQADAGARAGRRHPHLARHGGTTGEEQRGLFLPTQAKGRQSGR